MYKECETDRSSSSQAIPKQYKAAALPTDLIEGGFNTEPPNTLEVRSENVSDASRADIVVAGALAVDYCCDFAPIPGQANQSTQLYTSNPAMIRQSLGGVAHNVAKAVHYCGRSVSLYSAVGNDLPGRIALQQLASEGIQTSNIKSLPSARTAQYVAVNDDKKDLVVAMADMGILEQSNGLMPIWNEQLSIARPSWFIADANWEADALRSWFKNAKSYDARTAFEPVSTAKASRIFFGAKLVDIPVFPHHMVDLASPNALELNSMHVAARSAGHLERQDWWAVIDALGIPSFGARSRFESATSSDLTDQGIPQQSVQLLPFIPCILTKLGSKGVLLTMLLHKDDDRLRSAEAAPYIIARSRDDEPENRVGGVYMRLFAPAEIVADQDIVSVNGVGDTFLGALIASMASSTRRVEDIVDFAQRAAVLTLKSPEAVSPELRHLKW